MFGIRYSLSVTVALLTSRVAMATVTALRLATLITFAISCSLQVEYKAAVLEYEVNTGYGNVEELLHENAQNYVRYIRDAASQDTDIIVFPESTLNNGFSADRDKTIQNAFFLPDPSLNVAPCDSDEYHQVLTALSCEARRSRIYVVINVSEKRSCPDGPDPRPCSGDGYNLYNSNVVFDRDGKIVSRYRKTRLFGESGFNVTSSPEVEIFTTDFNVTFAHLICFDMMFPHPAATFLQRGVKNVIVPMMWYSELPFLTAVQYQQAWSFSRGVNLLAAGSNRPASGCGGSGVYSGRGGPRAALLAGDTRSALLVATLDSEPSDEVFEGTTAESVRPEGMAMLRDQLDHYSWKQINVWAAGGSDTSICHSDFCCKIITKATVTEVDPSEESYTYLAVAYDGVRTYSGVTTGGVQTCGVIACKGTDITTCGKMFSSAAIRNNIEFEEISVTGTFRKQNSIQFPVSVQGDLLPLGPNRFNYHVADYKYDADYSQVTMNLTGTVDDLLTFAIFGRDFSKDGLPITEKEIIKKSVKNTHSIKAYSMKISNADVPENETNLIENKPVYNETQDDGSVFKFIDYIPVKLQILIAVVSIYCLEQL